MLLRPSKYPLYILITFCADSFFQLGSTTVGIRTPDGVVLGVEKRVQSPLLEASSIEKIMEIDTHLGCAMSGLTADARTMIDHARVTAQNHAFTYDERIKVESVTQAVCDLALRFGESVHDEDAMMSRPFGVALLIAGIDELGPQLYAFPKWHRCPLIFFSVTIQILQEHLCVMMPKQSALVRKQRKASSRINGTRSAL
jgi:Proteasome subunit